MLTKWSRIDFRRGTHQEARLRDICTAFFLILTPKRRWQSLLLLLLVLSSGLLELVSFTLVVPFLSVLTNPNVLNDNIFITKYVLSPLGVTGSENLVPYVTGVFVGFSLTSYLMRIACVWFNGVLACKVGHDLSIGIYQGVIYASYEEHLQENSSDVVNNLIINTNSAAHVFLQLVQLTTAIVMAICLVTGMLIVDPKISGLALLSFSTLYLALAIFVKDRLGSNAKMIERLNARQIRLIQESIGGIRDIIMDASQPIFESTYASTDSRQRWLQTFNGFMASSPRYIFESMALTLIAVYAGLADSSQSLSEKIPLLGAIVLGSQKLLPVLQQVYNTWVTIKAHSAGCYCALSAFQTGSKTRRYSKPNSTAEEFLKLSLESVSYKYPGQTRCAVKNVDLMIGQGEAVALVGPSGCGKTSVADVIMGLLKPTSGTIRLNGIDIYNSSKDRFISLWRSSIAHVPQSVYLRDSSILNNITFDAGDKNIDFNLVSEAARIAQIEDFILSLPNKYDTIVGELGSRLSGGQCQRIGIARALYKNRPFLVLDEATSALDKETELQILFNIKEFRPKLTIIMITHRKSTTSFCSRVLYFEDGILRECAQNTLHEPGEY